MKASIENAANASQTIDTICFGFRFGMTSDEVHKYCEELLESGKLYLKDNTYMYDFHLIDNSGNVKDGIVKTTINADFHDDKLYRFYLNFDIKASLPESYQSIGTNYDLVRMDIASILMSRYNSEEMFYIEKADPFVVVIGNLIMELKKYSATIACATFTNMPVAKTITLQQKKEEREKARKTMSDL